MKELWTCPKCGRKFEKNNQLHSCNFFLLNKHFENRELAKNLFKKLKKDIHKYVGPFKIESLPCCIHLVSTFTFAAVYALKDRIRIHFTLDHRLESYRIDKCFHVSTNRYSYSIDIENEKEIDEELIRWLKQAYNLRKKR